MAAAFSLGVSLLEEEDVLRAVLQEADAAALRQLKASSVAWCAHARRELCNRLWVRLSLREGQPEPAGVDSITDLDVECLNEAGRPWEVVVAGRQLPQLARLHGYGYVVDVQAVREANLGAEEEEDDDDYEEDEDDPLGGDALRSCIQGEGDPPDELLLAAVACAASGTVRGVPVQRLREDDAIDELDLRDSGIGVTAATLLGLMLPAATSVRSLDLFMDDIEPEGASALVAVLKETQITYLNVDGYALQIDELKGTKPTEKIDLSCKGLGDASAIIIESCIKENGVLKELNIGCNRIGAEGASALAAVLKETQITDLNLANNQLCGLDHWGDGTYTTEGITKLCEGLKGSAVTSLDISSNRLGAEGAAALAEGLNGNSTLQVLDIMENYIGAEGASALAAILKETQIQQLDLEGNQLGPEGAAAIAEGLKGNTTLQSLDLYKNYIRAEGASALAAVIKETRISNLNIGYNRIGDKGASVLAAILKETMISDLDLRYNGLTDEATQALLQDAAGSSARITF